MDTLILPDTKEEHGIRASLEFMAAQAGTRVLYARQDLQIGFGDGTLAVYAPEPGASGNAGSLSVLASFDDYDILATGDLAIEQENRLLQTHTLPDIELLVAGHHGSSTSTGTVLLARTRPESVVISVGENSYGHPSEAALARIAAQGAQVYRTDWNGTISVGR